MTAPLLLPRADGTLRPHTPAGTAFVPGDGPPPTSRVAFAAAHVVADPRSPADPWASTAVDWDATLAVRRHLWSQGLGVAEALDTAQRGMGLDWPATRELIRRSVAEARAVGGRVACGAGTDQLDPTAAAGLPEVERAWTEQLALVEDAGGQAVLMASRAMAAAAEGPDDYLRVYGRLLEQVRAPVVLHWLGEVFDPALAGYWGTGDVEKATDVVVELVTAHADRVDGVKVSLLDDAHEVRLRARLPEGVRMYTGDDYHYVDLIAGDGSHHSDALLGAFAAIAPIAARALRALDTGDEAGYRALLEPTVPLARHVFADATRFYKTGIVFLAWLAGHQDHPRMVGGLESARSVVHLAELFVLADELGLLPDPELAATRMRAFLAVAGMRA